MPDLADTRADAERVVIDMLSGVGAYVAAAFEPNEDEPIPAVLVHRAGGGTSGFPPVMDAAVVGLDIYAATKEAAWDLTAEVLEILLGVDGAFVGSPPHAWVSACVDAGATIYLPDEATGRPRYSAVVRVYARGEAAVPG